MGSVLFATGMCILINHYGSIVFDIHPTWAAWALTSIGGTWMLLNWIYGV